MQSKHNCIRVMSSIYQDASWELLLWLIWYKCIIWVESLTLSGTWSSYIVYFYLELGSPSTKLFILYNVFAFLLNKMRMLGTKWTRDHQGYFTFSNLFLCLCTETTHSHSNLTSQTVREVYCIITKSTFQLKLKFWFIWSYV